MNKYRWVKGRRQRNYRFVWDGGRSTHEHRVIWKKAFGRIPKGYDIHHKNGDTMDNRITNLVMLSHLVHTRLHHPSFIRLPDGRWFKRCSACRKVKLLIDFYRINGQTSRDHHLSWCKACFSVYHKRKRREVIKNVG